MRPVPPVRRAVDAEVLCADSPMSSQRPRMSQKDGDILGLGDQIVVDPFLLVGPDLQGQEIDRLASPLPSNQVRNQQLGFCKRVNVAEENNLMLAERSLKEFNRRRWRRKPW